MRLGITSLVSSCHCAIEKDLGSLLTSVFFYLLDLRFPRYLWKFLSVPCGNRLVTSFSTFGNFTHSSFLICKITLEFPVYIRSHRLILGILMTCIPCFRGGGRCGLLKVSKGGTRVFFSTSRPPSGVSCPFYEVYEQCGWRVTSFSIEDDLLLSFVRTRDQVPFPDDDNPLSIFVFNRRLLSPRSLYGSSLRTRLCLRLRQTTMTSSLNFPF